MSTSSRIDRERIRRTLTFWLRPAFLLRALTRFQRITGFDRAVALASGTLTALIPLAIVISSLLPNADAASTARKIIGRYSLTGAGADAVRSLFSPAGGDVTGISVVGALLLVIAMLSFSRSMQRLFEQTWELTPLSVRNTPNDLLWLAGLVAYIALSWGIHRLIDRGAVQIVSNALLVPASAVFLLWTGWVLSARRVARRSLAPFAIVGAIVLAVYLTGAAAYAPHLFSSYASRYGAVGAVFAMISTLFGLMVALVGSAALGREVFEELSRIRRGEVPPEDEVRREWDALLDQGRLRWQTLRKRVDRRRHSSSPDDHRAP